MDPWTTVQIKDYSQVMREFGIDAFDPGALPKDPAPPRLFKEGIVFGHRGFGSILRRIKKGERFGVLSGLMPSGRMHLGHKMVIDQIKYFQNFRSEIIVGVADLEAYATRGMSLKDAERIAVESYIKNYLALGLGEPGLEIYFQSKRKAVKDLAFTLSRKVNLSTMKAIYGFNDQTNMAHMHAPLIQAADILHLQIKFGPMPVVVPVGIDQDPHIRLCRDLASSFRTFNATRTSDGRIGVFVKVDKDVEGLLEKAKDVLRSLGYLELRPIPAYKAIYVEGATEEDLPMIDEALADLEGREGSFGFVPPASTYHRFIRGLTGEKMSSSKPETSIFLDDGPKEASDKLGKALTGGRDTSEEQRKLGGRPEICPVFETMLFHTISGEKEVRTIEQECRSGARLCGQCKKEAIQYLVAFLKDLKERKDASEHMVKEFLKDD